MASGHSGLERILHHLMEHLSCLYDPGRGAHGLGRYRLVDSHTSDSFGDAGLWLKSDVLQVVVGVDRGQL